MSGFEVAGSLLGAFHLLLSSIDLYRNGLVVLKSSQKVRQQYHQLGIELKIEIHRIQGVLDSILTDKVPNAHFDGPVSAEIWRGKQFEEELRQNLGIRYNVIISILTQLQTSTLKLNADLQKWSTNDNKWRTLRASLSLSGYKSALIDIRTGADKLQELCGLRIPKYPEERRDRNIWKSLNRFRDLAVNLYDVLKDHTPKVRTELFLKFQFWDAKADRFSPLPLGGLLLLGSEEPTLFSELEIDFESLLATKRLLEAQPTQERRVQFHSTNAEREAIVTSVEVGGSESLPRRDLTISEFLGKLDVHQRRFATSMGTSHDMERGDMISLATLINSMTDSSSGLRSRLSSHARYAIGATITAVAVSLIDTPLFSRGFTGHEIFFLSRNGSIALDTIYLQTIYATDYDISEQFSENCELHRRAIDLGWLLAGLSIGMDKMLTMANFAAIDDPTVATILSLLPSIELESGISYSRAIQACIELHIEHGHDNEDARKTLFSATYTSIREICQLFQNQVTKESPVLQHSKSFNDCKTHPTTGAHEMTQAPSQIHTSSSQDIRTQYTKLELQAPQDFSYLQVVANEIWRSMSHSSTNFQFKTVASTVGTVVLEIEEGTLLVETVSLTSADVDQLLRLGTRLLDCFSGLERALKQNLDLEALNLTLSKLQFHGGAFSAFTDQLREKYQNSSFQDAFSIQSESSSLQTSLFEIDTQSITESSGTSVMEPKLEGPNALADEFVLLITGETLLGPLFVHATILNKLSPEFWERLGQLMNIYSHQLAEAWSGDKGVESHQTAALMLLDKVPYILSRLKAKYRYLPNSFETLWKVLDSGTMVDTGLTSIEVRMITQHRLFNALFPPDESYEPKNDKSEDKDTPRVVFALEKDILVTGRPFGVLRLGLRHLLGQSPLEVVEQEVLQGLYGSSEYLYPITIKMQWDLEGYLEQEVPGQYTLDSILTMTGDETHAYAVQCGSYLKWQWPKTDFHLLEAIESMLVNGPYESLETSLAIQKSSFDPSDSSLSCNITVSLIGDKQTSVQLAQQLAWLTCALSKVNSNGIVLSEAEFMWSGPSEFELRPGNKTLASRQSDVCWHALMSSASIAKGFPILARNGEVGLELPFQSLVHLSQVSAQLQWEDGVALYSPTRLLYPTSQISPDPIKVNQTSIVQWHLVTSQDPFSAADILGGSESWLPIVEPAQLISARTIVGYCKQVAINLGTENFEYGAIKASELDPDSSTPGVMIKSITVGTSGMGIFGVQASMDIVYPRTMEVSPKIETYDDILEITKQRSMILYDDSDQRGWLLPAQSVLLHMAHCWIRKYEPEVKLTYAAAIWHDDEEVDKILRADYKLKLRTLLDDDRDWYLRDLVKRLWRDLQGCMIVRKQRKVEERTQLTIPSTKLKAWDFMDFIGPPTTFFLREEKLDLIGCGWEALANDDDIFILAARGFGEVIEPTQAISLCQPWSRVPCKRLALAASIRCMKALPRSRVGGLCMQLTPRVSWCPSAADILDDCSHDNSHAPCRKNLEKVITRIKAANIADDTLPAAGAVIFGVKRLQKVQGANNAAKLPDDSGQNEGPVKKNKGSWHNKLLKRAKK